MVILKYKMLNIIWWSVNIISSCVPLLFCILHLLNTRCFCITSNLGFKIAPVGICIFNILRCMFHFLKTYIKCEWLYSSSINIIVMQILFHIKVYMQVSCFSILVSSNTQNVWLYIYIIKYMQNVWHESTRFSY